MCIICTGEIYKQNLNTLTELKVSNCPNLTSEKLQEILNRCKNLEILYCHHCISLTSLDLRSNINLIELYCPSCTSLTSLRSNIHLIELYCYSCTSLTSLDLRSSSEGVTSKGCINLVELRCDNCTSLTSLDLRNNINLVELRCNNCTSLTSLDLPKGYHGHINRSKCPWITQNKYFSNNLQKLLKIQRWYRRILIIKYMKSKQFIEWIYNPNNIGGKYHKLKLLKEFTYEIN